jgi:hypothetical protein
MTYADAIVGQARLLVGYREGPDNLNVFSGGLGRPPEAWYADFAQCVSALADCKQPYATASVVAIGPWAKHHDIWIDSSNATPGWQIYFS